MSATAKDVISMKLITSPGEKTLTKSNVPLSSFEVPTLSPEKQFLSLCSNKPSFNPETGTDFSLAHQSSFIPANSLLFPIQKIVDAKAKKKARSKAGPKNCKKQRVGTSSNVSDEETIDIDIFAFVESFDANKNLDSDSSTNTIIDDMNDPPVNNSIEEIAESKLCTAKSTKFITEQSVLKNMDFQSVNYKQSSDTSLHMCNSFQTLSSTKEVFNWNAKGNHLTVPNNSRVLSSTVSSSSPGSHSQGISQLTSIKKNENPKPTIIESNCSVSLLKEANVENLSTVYKTSVSTPFSDQRSILKRLTNDCSKDNALMRNYPNKVRKKSPNIIFGAQTVKETQNSIIPTHLMVPNLCQNDQKIYSQSFYASMGLDEDLCDSDNRTFVKNLNTNSASKESCSSSLYPPKCNNILNVPVKIEEDESFFIDGTKETKLAFDSKNETLLSNDLHVSMTFEAEPSFDEDYLEEDDLPLSVLKNRIPADEVVSKIKHKSKELNIINENLSEIHPSLFIKKELIEDEIVSESQAVSSKNLLTLSNANYSTEVETASCNDFLKVKIKTEPDTDFSCYESMTPHISTSINCSVTQVSDKATGSVPKICPEDKSDNLVEPAVSKRIGPSMMENTESSSTNSFVSETQLVDRLNMHNIPLIASGSTSNSKDSIAKPNFAENMCNTINKISKKTDKKESYIKNIELAAENVQENSTCVYFKLDKSLPKEVQQDLTANDDNSVASSSQHITDTDTESNSSKKKGKKRKSAKKTINIGENVPITLLIKRQKPDVVDENAPHSFLCTNVSKSGADEPKSTCALLTLDKTLYKDKEIINETENTLNEDVDVSLYSQNSVSHKKNPKKQRKRKKKQTKKSVERNISWCNMGNEAQQAETDFLHTLKVPVKSKSLDLQTKNRSKSCLETVSSTGKKCETYVYMTFEEQSSVEEITEDDINSVLSVKKETDEFPSRDIVGQSSDVSSSISSVSKSIKEGKDVSWHSKAKTSELLNTSYNNTDLTISPQVEDALSVASSVASNSNMEDDSSISVLSSFDNVPSELNSNIQTKKKKRRSKSYGWYKKKKSKTKKKNLSPVPDEIKESTPTLSTASKVPVVMIQNLPPEIELSNSEKKVEENYDFVHLERAPIELPAKSKKKKKKKAASGKRKKATGSNSFKNTLSLYGKDENNSKLSDSHLQTESDQLPSKGNLENSLRNASVPNKSCENSVPLSESFAKSVETNAVKKASNGKDDSLQSNILNSEAERSCSTVFPSLDVDEMRQEIVAYEAVVDQKNRSNSSDKCRQSTLGYDDNKELNFQSTVSEPNILKAFNSSFKLMESKDENTLKSFTNVQLKKEPDEYCKSLHYSSNQVSSFPSDCFNNKKLDCLHISAHITTSEKNSTSSKKKLPVYNANNDLLSNNLSVMKEVKDASSSIQDKSLKNLITAENSRSVLVLNSSAINSQSDKMTNKTNFFVQPETFQNLTQNSQSPDIDKIALSIKKEVAVDAKSRSSNYGIKDQNDLIQKACGTEAGNLIVTATLSCDNYDETRSVGSVKLCPPDLQLKGNIADVDDEIQILKISDQNSSKNIPFVDLTDDNCMPDLAVEIQQTISESKPAEIHSMHVSTAQVTAMHCSTTKVGTKHDNMQSRRPQIISKISSDELTQLEKTVKGNTSVNDTMLKEKILIRENVQNVINQKEDVSLSGKFEKIPNECELSKSKIDVLSSHFVEEKDDPVKLEIGNSLISRDKYIEEYFKHPFPPSMVFYNSKQRNRNKIYTRINSKAWNLSIEAVESRLKLSENVMPQFGKKLGDVVRLERYPVSISEVECYHRILGVAPSHKLLSKCYKSPDKRNTAINCGFKVFPGYQQANIKKYETDKQFNQMTCSINDIFQGIAETKMMYPNMKNNFAVYERDCPSTDTRDSCDSRISNISSSQSRDLKTSNNINQVKENEYVCASTITDTNYDGRSSVLSCKLSDFNETSKTDVTNLGFTAPKSSDAQFINSSRSNENVNSSNVLKCLNLPTQEVINNLVNNANSNFCLETCDKINNFPGPRNDTLVTSESHSSTSCYSSNANKINDESKLQKEYRQVFNIFNAPVTELRKILETAGSLSSDTVNYDNECLWKSKATFEYNHTQSVPLENIKSTPSDVATCSNPLSQCTPNDSLNDVLQPTENIVSEGVKSLENIMQGDSDNDCIDNEPIDNENSDRDEDSFCAEEHNSEEHAIPLYKSKWEKIMERKSLENKERERVNEHLLKDCFPVSSTIRVQNKNNKNVSKSSCKEPESSTKKHYKKGKKNDKISAKRNFKYTKSCKEEQNRTKRVTEKLAKKSKAKANDLSNLFVPDKHVEISKEAKSVINNKSRENDKSKRFYGNRITNRGTFLTESSRSTELLKQIKIPKKKLLAIPKKPVNVRSEEFHSMVKSPDINIESTFHSSYKVTNKSHEYRKCSEYYRSPLQNTSSPASSHFIRTKQMRDKRMLFPNSRQERLQNQSSPLLNHTYPDPPHNLHHNNRKTLLNASSSISSHHSDDGTLIGRNIPVLGVPPPISSHHCNDESRLNRNFPTMGTTISSQLPSKKFQTNNEMGLLQNIISVINSNKTSSVPEMNNDILPFSEHLTSTWDKSELNSLAYNCNESSVGHIPMMPGEPITTVSKSYGIILPPESFQSVPNIHLEKQFDPPFDFPGILNSPPFTAAINSNVQIASQPSRKATCLVPQHLKTLVGHEIVETSDVRLLMLEWSVDWLVQQQKFHDPPPISNALKKVVSTYNNFEDYYNTYFPLMLLDTWHRIYVSWTHLNQTSPYSCQVISYSVKSHYISVECQTVFNTAAHPKGVFPDEGSILMVKYCTKSNEYNIKILGYVTNVKTRRFNSVTDSKLCSSLRCKDTHSDVLQILTLTFMGAYNSEDIDKRQPVRIHVLCNVKPTLKQNDAMMYINKSPLQRSILNPVADGLLSVTLTPRNSPLEKVSDCVRDITKGILSPHPLPLLTVVKAKPESDRLNIIPMLIEKMKNTYKTKVLLCVRTVRALGDIAANICLNQSLKLVIVNKRCDTNPQFQKYLLDDIATAEINKISEDKIGEKLHVRNEVAVKVRKQVLKECDVVLSLIRNCHDEFIGETFMETDCGVSQMCCIVDEANLCTEPETLIPILHGISKLILIGDPDYPAKVLSKTASAYDYSRSFFQRAYNLDLITE